MAIICYHDISNIKSDRMMAGFVNPSVMFHHPLVVEMVKVSWILRSRQIFSRREEQLDPLQFYAAELREQSLETDEGLSSLWRFSCNAQNQQHLHHPEAWRKIKKRFRISTPRLALSFMRFWATLIIQYI